MELLIIRHGLAEERGETGKRDASRRLTKRGIKRTKRAAKGLHKMLAGEIDVLATSPLIRAVQTADLFAAAFDARPCRRGELAPGKRVAAVLEWLKLQDGKRRVAIVGHEPQLGILTSWLISGLQESFVQLKKSAIACVDFPDAIKPGGGKLKWLMSASQLAAQAT
ncbi:MAG TPA: phosphohistidine phosphatase SixA [Tepidisphaeraceae bacterium]|jgi:phosphohistidine phosphatase